MTICIAAICEKGTHLVVAADRMFTAGAPLNLEFEPPLSKIEKLSHSCVAMASGASLYAAEIAEKTRGRLGEMPGARVLQIAGIAKEVYVALRNEKIDEQILGAQLGSDFSLFRSRGGYLPMYLQAQPNIYQQMVIQTSQFNLGVDLLFAGFEIESAHIYHLTHPGTLTSFDKLGYNAIGSGALHAMVRLHLGEQCPGSSLPATLHSVYDAKLAAEVAPGVGQETEMAVVSRDGTWTCPQKLIDELKIIRNASIQKSKPDIDKVKKIYDEQRSASGVPKD